MKKAIILLAVAFSLTYCNPSQQADQTTTDSAGRMSDTTSSSSSMMSTDTAMKDTSGMMKDTTMHPDSLPH